jgi:tetratricopeptide (TPR) repeat protein
VPVPLPPLLPPPAIKIKEERQVASANVIAATPREAMARRVDALPAERNGGSNAERVTLRPAATIIAQISPALSAGYAALATGDYANAKRYYAEAISTNSNSADAHLGFATANARSGSPGDSALAIRHYERVLEIDPRNSTARAALLVMGASKSVGGPGNSLTSGEKEAELKLLIAQDPAAANLHFLLGNFYADARRWSEAQQAYFEAARLVPQNGDYCFNLGVSLDQLGQAASAVTFYRRALAATIKGQFEPDVVQRRIAALTAISKPRTGQ